MKLLILILAVLLSGCEVCTPTEHATAVESCASFGGLKGHDLYRKEAHCKDGAIVFHLNKRTKP